MSDYDEDYNEDYDEGEHDEEDEDDLEYNDFGHVPHGQPCDNGCGRKATRAVNDSYYCDVC